MVETEQGVIVAALRAASDQVFEQRDRLADPAPSGQVADDAFQPARAVQTPSPSGGVETTAEPVRPSHTRQYVPSSPLADADGFVDFPNISLVEQIVELKQASVAYEANARVVEEEDERLGTLLDRLK